MFEEKIKKLLRERHVKETVDEGWKDKRKMLREEILDSLLESKFLEDKIFILKHDNILTYQSTEPIHPLISKLQDLFQYTGHRKGIVKGDDGSFVVNIVVYRKEVDIYFSCFTTEEEFDEMIEILRIKIDTVKVDETLTRMSEEMKIFEVMKKYTTDSTTNNEE